MTKNNLSIVSLFSGAMGLDLGLESAGFEIKVAIEKDRQAVATIKANRQEVPVLDNQIEDISSKEILNKADLGIGEVCMVVGGPSCQSFSTAGSRGSINDPRGNLFREFIRVVEDIRPRFFIMENVKGILSAAISHRPLNQRGPGFPPLEANEELGSAFQLILSELKSTGYYVVFGLLNSADYGVPQKRERLIVMGSRDGEPISMPIPTHSQDGSGKSKKWTPFVSASKGLQEEEAEYRPFSDEQVMYLDKIPKGGNWKNLPLDEHEAAIGGAYHSWGGRTGFLRRLRWDQPSPALTTNPTGKATIMCHPESTRPLSVQEYARIQQFPDHWVFLGNTTQKYKQIGNAVPIGLGEAIGNSIRRAMSGPKVLKRLGTVISDNEELIAKIAKRPKTILNPPRMREIKEKKAEREWLGGMQKDRSDIYDFMGRLVEIKSYPDISLGNGQKIDGVYQKRWKAHRITLKLHELYGSPTLNNKQDPLDEFVFITLSLMTTEPSYNRVFQKLKDRIGSWEEVLSMDLRILKSIIKDAGLSNQKAPRIKSAFKKIKKDFQRLTLDPLQNMSDKKAEQYLTSLPGIGVKAAKCIMLYSFGRQVLPIDTHVRRVSHRLGLLSQSASSSMEHELLETVVPPTDRYSYHVNAVEHGRQVCVAKQPKCEQCPLTRSCEYYRENVRQ